MIGKEPESLEKFPVPVVGTPIPRGWFSRLVAFMNSLVLHGDNQYFMVSHSNAGTSIAPTKKLVDLLHTRGGGAPASGAAQDLSVSVSGGTATVSISGSTSAVPFVAGANVNITGSTNGEVIVSATGGTAGGAFFPDYGEAPVTVSGGTIYPVNANMWLIGYAGLYKTDSSGGFPSYVDLKIYGSDGITVTRTISLYTDAGVFSTYNSYQPFHVPVCMPIKSGYQIEILSSGAASFFLQLFHI